MRLSILEVPNTGGQVQLKCLQCFVPMHAGSIRLVTGLWAEKSSKFAIISRRAESILATIERWYLCSPVHVPNGTAQGVPLEAWLDRKFPVEDVKHMTARGARRWLRF